MDSPDETVARMTLGCIHAIRQPRDFGGFVRWKHFQRIAAERPDLLSLFWQRLNKHGQAVRALLEKQS